MGTSSTLLPVGPLLGATIVLVVLAAAAAAAIARLGHGAAVLRACLRAVIQLAVVSLLISAVVSSGPLTAAFVAMMLGVASFTAGRRFTDLRHTAWAALPVCAAVVPFLLLLMASGLLRLEGLVIIPIAGILTGGALTATAMTGQRVTEALTTRRGEVEAALSLGFTERDAALEIGRSAAASALVPALDQTRTVGLVTLPGAFVGMLMGGASPIAAGAVQLFVLTALLLVEAIAIALCLELVARGVIPHRAAS